MNTRQRIVVILYCILFVYCCVWIPWHYQFHYPADLPRPSGFRRMEIGNMPENFFNPGPTLVGV